MKETWEELASGDELLALEMDSNESATLSISEASRSSVCVVIRANSLATSSTFSSVIVVYQTVKSEFSFNWRKSSFTTQLQIYQYMVTITFVVINYSLQRTKYVEVLQILVNEYEISHVHNLFYLYLACVFTLHVVLLILVPLI